MNWFIFCFHSMFSFTEPCSFSETDRNGIRKEHALCIFFLIRKRNKTGEGILEQDLNMKVIWWFQFLDNEFLLNCHYFLSSCSLYSLPPSFPCSLRHIFLLLLKWTLILILFKGWVIVIFIWYWAIQSPWTLGVFFFSVKWK